ncbi:MAG: ABC transporter permease [Vicinamibacterales bacterium]
MPDIPSPSDRNAYESRRAKADLSSRSAKGPRPDLPSRSAEGAKADRRFAWWLVWLYPPEFRRDVGLGLVDALDDRMRARRGDGASRIGARLPAIADTLRNAPVEWAAMFRQVRPKPDTTETGTRPQTEQTGVSGFGRTAGGRTVIDKLLQDVRYALRLWRRRPAFAAVAILTLALGVGANTAMFSIVNAVLLRPLPYPNADRLVSVYAKSKSFRQGLLSYAEYEAIRARSGTIESIGLYLGQSVNLTGSNEPQRLVGSFVSGSFFDVLGLKAERGRLFSETDTAPGTVAPVVVISHQLWRQRYNEEAAAIGQTLTVNGTPLTVVGVMEAPAAMTQAPGDGYFIGGVDLFVPVALYPTPHGLRAAGPQLLGVGRLKGGTTVATANADLHVIGRQLLAADPKTQAGRELTSESAHETVVGASRPALLLLLASVGVVLLIACVNVSQLLLARAIDRQKEIALRAALGASRSAVTRQLAIEAAMMAIAATTLGFVLGRWALAGLSWLQPPSVPIPSQLPLDATVLLFTGGVAVAVATLCGLAPALRSSRPDISRVLQAGFRRASGEGRHVRDALAIVEMALSVALVAVSVLLIQSLLAVQQVPLGFDPANVFTLQFRLPQTKYSKPEDIARFFKSAIENVRAVPGVQSAALVRAVPFSGNGGLTGYAIEGQPTPDPAQMPQARFHLVTPDYFKTLRIPLLKGRDFTDRDDLKSPLVSLVNETFARTAWPAEDPIGRQFTTPNTQGPVTVIGVVGDTKHYTATEPAIPQLYIAHYQVPLIFSSLVARVAGAPMSITNDVKKAIWSVDKDQPVWTIRSLEAQVEATQGQQRFLALLLGIFAGVALLLAGVGIYGVTSYGVAQRTHEIGIRLALGASGDRVLRDVVSGGVRLTLIAVAIGLVGAVVMGRLASAVLFAVTPIDPVALAGSAFVLGVVSIVACYIPARRASRVDPVVALGEY